MIRMTTAENDLAISDGYATPATPAWNTNTPITFPAILIPFATREMFIVTFVFPMLRQTAAPAL